MGLGGCKCVEKFNDAIIAGFSPSSSSGPLNHCSCIIFWSLDVWLIVHKTLVLSLIIFFSLSSYYVQLEPLTLPVLELNLFDLLCPMATPSWTDWLWTHITLVSSPHLDAYPFDLLWIYVSILGVKSGQWLDWHNRFIQQIGVSSLQLLCLIAVKRLWSSLESLIKVNKSNDIVVDRNSWSNLS